MIGEDRIRTLLGRALRHPAGAGADGVEVALFARNISHTRVANNTVIQDSYVEEATLQARALAGGALGTARTNDLSDAGVGRAVARAVEAARTIGRGTFLGFATQDDPPCTAGRGGMAEPRAFDERTATLDPEEKASELAGVCQVVRRAGMLLAAHYHTGSREVGVANSTGLSRYHRATTADARLNVLEGLVPGDSSSYAGRLSTRHDEVDLRALGDAATDKALLGRAPRPIEAGVYDVLLEPPAVAELVEWMGQIGFSSRAMEDGTSFLAGRMGEPVTGERVTILDDAPSSHGHGIPAPFDAEGTATRTLTLIEEGRGLGTVHNLRSAARAGCASTGHAIFDEWGFGETAAPAHLLMLGGDHGHEELMSLLDDGLWVNRFHYVNAMLEPRRAVMTGLTRDGLFRVRGGKVRHGVRNLRFTDSILEAFARIDGLSRALVSVPTWWSSLGALTVPCVLIRGLRFTGTTDE